MLVKMKHAADIVEIVNSSFGPLVFSLESEKFQTLKGP